MAFVNKVGNLLKHSVVKHINQELSASTPSIYQAIRSMSSAKLFVGGISYSTDDMSLREAFSRYGEIIDARVIIDRETGRSRGFGFITFATSEDASSAVQGMDGQDLHGRMIRVNYATERSRPGFGGGGSGGGGYAGSNYGGNDYRTGSYGSSGYGVRDSYGGGNARTRYTGGGNVDSGVYDGSGRGNYGVGAGAGASNYQFNEHSGGDLGSVSSELSSNSGLGYDDGQFGSNQNDRTGRDDGGSIGPFEDNLRENDDEPDDYAQPRR